MGGLFSADHKCGGKKKNVALQVKRCRKRDIGVKDCLSTNADRGGPEKNSQDQRVVTRKDGNDEKKRDANLRAVVASKEGGQRKPREKTPKGKKKKPCGSTKRNKKKKL